MRTQEGEQIAGTGRDAGQVLGLWFWERLTGRQDGDRADVVRKTQRRFAAAEIRLLVEEAERIKDHELVEHPHDVLDRLELPAARRVLHEPYRRFAVALMEKLSTGRVAVAAGRGSGTLRGDLGRRLAEGLETRRQD